MTETITPRTVLLAAHLRADARREIALHQWAKALHIDQDAGRAAALAAKLDDRTAAANSLWRQWLATYG